MSMPLCIQASRFSTTLLIGALLFTSCLKDEVSDGHAFEVHPQDRLQSVVVGTPTSGTNVQNIWAGQNINAGQLLYDDVDTDGDNVDDALQVTYQMANGWELMAVHFFIGASLSELPVNRSGNPQPGQFPFHSGPLPGISVYHLTIPFSAIGFSCPNTGVGSYYVAAHCVVRKPLSAGIFQTETGWGNGQRLVQRGNWAMYSLIFITCDVNDPPVAATTETAFAYDGDPTGCFQNYSQFLDNPQRWGWTNGPLTAGTYTFPLYAGAGLCDTTKGRLVGKVLLVYNGSSATVTYLLFGIDPGTELPYTLREAHVWLGSEEFPKITNGNQAGQYTISPGRYPYKATGLTGQTQAFTISGLSGSIYLIAHAVVHGFPEG